jgi:anti-sigma regulatory factor (Ser/Thr protein kinase)
MLTNMAMDGPARNPSEVTFHIDDDDFKMQIRDYGKECDSSQIKPLCLDQIKSGGLGTHFTNEIMDNYSYCTERLKGTLLTMVKKLKAS